MKGYNFAALPGRQYRIFSKLCSSMGCSDLSNSSAIVYAADVPAKLPMATHSASTNTQITFSWTAPEYSGPQNISANGSDVGSNGAPVTGYTFTITQIDAVNPATDENGTALFAVPSCATCGQSVTVSQATSVGTSYTFQCTAGGFSGYKQVFLFRVAAENQRGLGEYSDAYAGRCSAGPDPATAPNYIRSVSNSSQVIEYTVPELHGAKLTGATLWQSTGASNTTFEMIANNTDPLLTSWTIDELVPGVIYRYRVIVYSDSGASTPSAIVNIPAGELPPAGSLSVASSTNSQIVLQVTLPSYQGGAALSGWKLYESEGGWEYPGWMGNFSAWDYDSPIHTQSGVSTLTYTRTGCTNGEDYFYKVQLVGIVGDGVISPMLRAVCALKPDMPSSPVAHVASATNTSITVDYTHGIGYRGGFVHGKMFVRINYVARRMGVLRHDFGETNRRFGFGKHPPFFFCKGQQPNIAQLAERSTVDFADIEWSLVRFRVFGFFFQNSPTQAARVQPAGRTLATVATSISAPSPRMRMRGPRVKLSPPTSLPLITNI